jgi:eukaryotic-like serine/threonine-protein kinase
MTEPVSTGQIVAGKFRVDRIIGQGSMGLVVAATHLALKRRVALKFMVGGGPAAKQREERFLREARAASMLQSRHVGKVLDAGTLEDGAPYIVMELLDGMDLASELKQRGKLPVADAVACVLQACEAVAEAHAHGIIHRDIKPANLFSTRGAQGARCIKVVDFGIAKVGAEASLDLTGTSQALGSPLYMSPEQMASTKNVDARTDIWSLGIVLYELLAATTPFAAETIPAVCARVFGDAPTPLAGHRPDVPPGLAAVIARCLEKDPARRWPHIEAFRAALAPYAHARAAAPAAPVEAPKPVMAPRPAAPSPPAATVIDPPRPAAPEPPPRSRAPAVAAVLLSIGLPLAVFFGLRARAPASPATPVVTAEPTPSVAAPPVPTAPSAPTAPSPTASPSASASAAPEAAASASPPDASASASAPASAAAGAPSAPRAGRGHAPASPPPASRPRRADSPPPVAPPPVGGPWRGSRQ